MGATVTLSENHRCKDGLWIAVQVRCGMERMIAQSLRNRGYVEFTPLNVRKVRQQLIDSCTALFPGYLFCRYVQNPAFRIVEIPGVVRLVGTKGGPVSIPETEIDRIKLILESGLPVRRCPPLVQGKKVQVQYGPLSGLEGILMEFRQRCQIVVSIPLLRRAVSVRIDESEVIPVE